MKYFLLSFFFLTTVVGTAQGSTFIQYQAVARDNVGALIKQHDFAVKVSILDGLNGSSLYSEVHQVTTNDFGLFHIKIGLGDPVNGIFSELDWNNEMWLQTAIDLDNIGNFVLLGTSRLGAVPYALFARNTLDSGIWLRDELDSNIHTDYDHVGIGVGAPIAPLDIQGSVNVRSGGYMIDSMTIVGLPGTGNIIYGPSCGSSLEDNPLAAGNLFVGYRAGYSTGNFQETIYPLGSENVGVGFFTLQDNRRGSFNVGMGRALEKLVYGNANVAIGHEALANADSAYYNVAIGSGSQLDNINGHRNTSIGTGSGTGNETGWYNVWLGGGSGSSVTDGFSSISIGYGSIARNNNELVIGSDQFLEGAIYKGRIAVSPSYPDGLLVVDTNTTVVQTELTVKGNVETAQSIYLNGKDGPGSWKQTVSSSGCLEFYCWDVNTADYQKKYEICP